MNELTYIVKPRLVQLAKLLGGLLRVVYLLTISMPSVIENFSIKKSDKDSSCLQFVLPHEFKGFIGEKLEKRLQQLAKLSGKQIYFCFE